MLTKEILNTLTSYTSKMQKTVSFVVQQGEHPKRDELIRFLQQISDVSDHLSIKEQSRPNELRSPISFLLEVDGEDSGIRFSGIPAGHEFNSLILAILHASGTALELDESLQSLLSNIKQPLNFEVFISLSCHNCPEVVQALNQFALINPLIKNEMIDGGLFPQVIQKRDIQGVPSVYLNGELFANGKVTAAELIEKLIERDSSITQNQQANSLSLQDTLIIGGGPAGVSAAIYSARKGLKVTLVADRIGGQVKDTMAIENLISVSKTTGPELAASLQSHMNDYDINLKEHVKVTHIEQGDVKVVQLSSGEQIRTKSIIISTGAKWRELGVPGEKENVGNGVAYCPHCDGPFFKGKDVAVVGGGNSGIEAALDLAGIVKSVTVLEFMQEFKADQVLIEQVRNKDNINLLTSVAVKSINAVNDKVNGMEYLDRTTETVKQLDVDGVFVQIGLQPNSDFVTDLVDRNPVGEIIINEKGETSAKGIYACGDVTTVPFKQIIVSMGEGAKASLSAFDYLLKRGDQLEQAHQQSNLIGLEEEATSAEVDVARVA
ncbi:MAG: alkyl hydroperoxide reductase subunit F [Kangiellaceae bacterium]|nr:alkyl hydroperoxide reductase subunit F [Kangiellaceae bacterium]